MRQPEPPEVEPWEKTEFKLLRRSIVRNLVRKQRGLPIEHLFYLPQRWNEELFWLQFEFELNQGCFNGFLAGWDRQNVPDMCGRLLPHFREKRFDHAIRAWASYEGLGLLL